MENEFIFETVVKDKANNKIYRACLKTQNRQYF